MEWGGAWTHDFESRGRPCNWGLSGCTEQYISGTAIYNRYNELSTKEVKSAAEVFDLLNQGDSYAMQVIEEFKRDLVDMALSLNNIFDPQGYVIGGGLIEAKKYWWDDIVNGVNAYKHTNIFPAELGNRAGLVGVAKLILDYIL